ncbi:hypothetical protein B0H66DRAFT_346061 [Apodospora peruviana]|uniref:Tetraspanin n=1 Tax=Apodospora peruviana TaxID=516989 RepID=A0AAE0I0U2_9PEZI|nr:hypothetical protein B0H66DRAFT_346061 [Apodospora peruviana]
MAFWIVLYPLLVAGLIAVAIYEHVNTTKLSLPISSALTFLTILLPLIAAINAVYFPKLVNMTRSSGSTFQQLIPHGLQVLQLILTTVLATIFSANITPSGVRECLLESKWKGFWTSHDGDAIKRIQDTFDCCGFRTVKDMAWPFPHGRPDEEHIDCVSRFGRTSSCKAPWQQALQKNTGVDFGVVLAVAVLQLVSLVAVKLYNAHHPESFWGRLFRAFARRRGEAWDPESDRPLLTGGDGEGGYGGDSTANCRGVRIDSVEPER